jgi:hypothetical protein
MTSSNKSNRAGLLSIVAACILSASTLTGCFTDYTDTVRHDGKKTTTITLPRGKGTYLGLFGKGMVYYGMDRDSTLHISLPNDDAKLESIDATQHYFYFNDVKYDIIHVTNDTLKVSCTKYTLFHRKNK